jgi:hypothetical protein
MPYYGRGPRAVENVAVSPSFPSTIKRTRLAAPPSTPQPLIAIQLRPIISRARRIGLEPLLPEDVCILNR